MVNTALTSRLTHVLYLIVLGFITTVCVLAGSRYNAVLLTACYSVPLLSSLDYDICYFTNTAYLLSLFLKEQTTKRDDVTVNTSATILQLFIILSLAQISND